MFRKVSLCHLPAAILTIGIYSAAAISPAKAQSPQTLKAFATEAHVGPVEKALVGVEVSSPAQDGNSAIRRGNGIVIRCDGFVLTSQTLFGATVNTSNLKVWVTLYPGTEDAKRVAARVVGNVSLLRRAFTGKPEPLVVLRLADVHNPALRLLLPCALMEEKQAVLAWSAWDAQAGRFTPIQKRSVALLDPAKPVNAINSRLQFAQNETLPIPGAVIIGPEGMGIGLTTASGASAPDFATFATLNSLTNCVTPLTATDAQFTGFSRQAGEEETAISPAIPLPENGENGQTETSETLKVPDATANPGTDTGGMARIPGGPVRLNSLLRTYQQDMASAQTACVAPFLMDRNEVTNRQYWKFWQSLSPEDKQRHKTDYYPIAWSNNVPPFPQEIENVPVLGVHLAGAQAYAQWQGKRLPTPYEWCLAAFGPNGGTQMPAWVQRYASDRRDTWGRIILAHYEYTELNPGVRNTGQESVPPEIIPDSALPWLFWYPFETQHVRFSYNTVMQQTKHLWQDWKDPQHILPVGSRKFDVSPYGIKDMVFNGAEIVMPGSLWTSVDNAESSDYYIQVGFPNISLEGQARNSPWRLYNPHAIHLAVASPVSVLPEPLISRRLRGPVTLGTTDAGIYADFMNVNAKLREVSDMIMPVEDGVVGIAPGPQRLWMDHAIFTSGFREESEASVRQRHNQLSEANTFKYSNGKIHIGFRDTTWFQLWRNADMPQHREMGLDVTLMPLASPPLTPQQDPTLVTYLVPGGFRCVR